MIELTINGKKVLTKKGSTILEAALSNGIKIPNLCYDKRVAPHGGCRLCVVEIEGNRKLEASCATFATDGIVVRTDTPRVRKIRQTVLELMLIHHPLDCPVCDKAGECDVQDLVFQYGKPTGRFVMERKNALPYTKGALVELNANRCILCGKCVRVCAEHQGRGALGFIGRGFPTTVQPAFGDVLECDNCGQCIDVCPTGALLNKSFKHKARAWFLEENDTICSFCGCGCTLTLGTMDGKILRSRGIEDKGVNDGNLCGRGRFGFDYIYSGNRLKSPLIRKEGALVPVSWDEALNYISSSLKYINIAHGPSFVGGIGSPRCSNEENYIFQKFMREIIGSDNIDSSAAFGYGLVEKAWETAFGQSGHRIDLKSPIGKEVILVIESDLSITHPVFGLNILEAKRKGSNLIVVDSRETKLTRHSTRWTRIREGTGVAFLNGIMRIIMDRGLFDKQNVPAIKGFSALEEAVQEYTPEKVFEITGITEEELVAVTEALVQAASRMLTLSISASENTKGLDTILAATNLINLLGESPDALQIPAEYANTFGLYQMGIRPDAGPIYQTSQTAGKGVIDMLYEPDSLKALYIMGADPLVTFPNKSKIISALKSLDLLIVQDIAFTETAKLAHVILPASSWAEKDGTIINTEGVTQRVHKVTEPTGQSLPDWQIIKNLASSMGQNIGIKNREDIVKQINSLLAEPLPHGGSISTRSKSLSLVASEARLEINEKDAERFGISDNCHVKLTSRQGTAYLKASVSDEVPDGIVYVPSYFPPSGVSTLTKFSGDGGFPVDTVRIETA
jgi:formate dehydrogenase alpha subunit